MKNTPLLMSVVLIVTIAAGLLFINFNNEEIPGLVFQNSDTRNSSEYLNAQRAAGYYKEQIEKNPGEIKNYIELAQIFIQEARTTGLDHEYISRAQKIIDIALTKSPDNNEALITKASILLSLHRFNEARPIAEKVVSRKPYFAHAYGVLCDTYVELGEYDKAVKACDKMLSIRPDLSSYSRASYLRELHGQHLAAIEAMKLAAEAGMPGTENRAWALYNLGNLFLQSGKPDTAAFIYAGILEERPNYSFALSGLAKIEMLKKNFERAEELIKQAHTSAPVHTFLEQLAELYLATGQKYKKEETLKEVLDEYAHHEEDGYNIDLEYAGFCAAHNINQNEAYNRIRNEYDKRPNNIEVLRTYALVLHRMEKNNEAAAQIQKAIKFNGSNPAINYLAGQIFYSLNQIERSSEYFAKAAEINPFHDILYANVQKK